MHTRWEENAAGLIEGVIDAVYRLRNDERNKRPRFSAPNHLRIRKIESAPNSSDLHTLSRFSVARIRSSEQGGPSLGIAAL